MSSQKYAKLIFTKLDLEEGEQESEGYVWHCKITKEECLNTSFSNGKPMCERCSAAKIYKGDIKRGKERLKDILGKKLSETRTATKTSPIMEEADGEFESIEK